MASFSKGQKVFVSNLHNKHSIWKKQEFLGRVVTVLSSNNYKDGVRYFVCLSCNRKRTIFLNERYLEKLDHQVLNMIDSRFFDAESASEISHFDENIRSENSTNEAFVQGVVYSAARVIELTDEPTISQSLLFEAGITRMLAVQSCCDEYDLSFIDKAAVWPN